MSRQSPITSLKAAELSRPVSGLDGRLYEFGQSPEIGRAPDLVSIVMVRAGDDVEGFGWYGCLEDLSTQLDRDDVGLVAVNDQLRERQGWKTIYLAEGRPKERMNWQPTVMESGHCLDRWKRRFENQSRGRLLHGKFSRDSCTERAPEYDDAFGMNHPGSREIVMGA